MSGFEWPPVPLLLCAWFEQPPVFLWHNLQNFSCLSLLSLQVPCLSLSVYEFVAFFHVFFLDFVFQLFYTCINFPAKHVNHIVYSSNSLI